MKKQTVIKVLAKKSGIIQSEKQPSNNVTSNKIAQLVKYFFTGPVIVYTVLEIKDEITSWTNGTKKRERKYYLIMFMQEVYKIYTELPVSDQVNFSKFCDLLQKNVLLSKQFPVDQCKCIIHKSFINKLKDL